MKKDTNSFRLGCYVQMTNSAFILILSDHWFINYDLNGLILQKCNKRTMLVVGSIIPRNVLGYFLE